MYSYEYMCIILLYIANNAFVNALVHKCMHTLIHTPLTNCASNLCAKYLFMSMDLFNFKYFWNIWVWKLLPIINGLLIRHIWLPSVHNSSNLLSNNPFVVIVHCASMEFFEGILLWIFVFLPVSCVVFCLLKRLLVETAASYCKLLYCTSEHHNPVSCQED